MKYRTAPALLLVAITFSLIVGCGAPVRYRHEVEDASAKTNWTEGMGGFVRYDGYENVAGDFEIAVAEYKKTGSPVTIQMVGVVHIADRDYYEELQTLLDDADLVLYEGVGPGEGRIFPMVTAQWRVTAEMMGTAAQVNALRYRPGPQWVQVDLATDPQGMQKAIKTYSEEHGKAFPKEFPLAFGFAGDRGGEMDQGQSTMAQAMGAIHKVLSLKRRLPERIRRRQIEDAIKHQQAIGMSSMQTFSVEQYKAIFTGLKQQAEALARQTGVEAIGKAAKAFDLLIRVVEFYGTYIVEIRNQHVMVELEKRLAERSEGTETQQPITIAVFYGAAHLQDFDMRLQKIGFHQTGKQWFKAWKMNSKR